MAIKKILISQNKGSNRSPYDYLQEKYGVIIDYRKFIKIEGLSLKEVRKQKVDFNDYSAIIFTSKVSVDYFFKLIEDMKFTIPSTMKYVCINEVIALYLQKYTVYRKRKVAYGQGTYDSLIEVIKRMENEKFLLPVAENHKGSFPNKLKKHKIDFDKVVLYRTVSEDLSDVKIDDYDIVTFFSPAGLKSLIENFPDFTEKGIKLAVYGSESQKEAKKLGLNIDIKAPTKKFPTMVKALEYYIKKYND